MRTAGIIRDLQGRRFAQMMAGIAGMGAALAVLLNVGYGTDPCAFLNNTLAVKLGLPMGTIMIMTNLIYFVPEFLVGRRLIGIGTIANMTLMGYVCDFCRFVMSKAAAEDIFRDPVLRPVIFAVFLLLFMVCGAFYMNACMGQAPYDAVSTIISERAHIPFSAARILWDSVIILTGVLCGGTLTIGTILIAMFMGPTVSFIGKLLQRRNENII